MWVWVWFFFFFFFFIHCSFPQINHQAVKQTSKQVSKHLPHLACGVAVQLFLDIEASKCLSLDLLTHSPDSPLFVWFKEMSLFGVNRDLLLYFTRQVELDLTGDAGPGFDIVPAGAPPLDRHSTGCFISHIQQSSEAAAKQLLAGDYLLKINGEDASAMTVDEVRVCACVSVCVHVVFVARSVVLALVCVCVQRREEDTHTHTLALAPCLPRLPSLSLFLNFGRCTPRSPLVVSSGC